MDKKEIFNKSFFTVMLISGWVGGTPTAAGKPDDYKMSKSFAT